ncbi:MAG: phosphopantetheinyl transferase [Marmoricola sp.]|nr:phosphopantetheinyl transferase [Marmoricola sp.]
MPGVSGADHPDQRDAHDRLAPGARPSPAARAADRRLADELLRAVVAEHVGVATARVQVGRTCPRCASAEHGRPHARVEGGARVWVSLARAGDVVVAAACREAPVGVDLESWDAFPHPGYDEVVLHAREQAVDAADQAVTWVRKESLLKATGLGLTVDPRVVRLTPAASPPALVSWGGPGPAPVARMRDLLVPGHAACLTVLTPPGADDGSDPRVSLRWAGPAGPPGPTTTPGGR